MFLMRSLRRIPKWKKQRADESLSRFCSVIIANFASNG
jgi:hypothetical protein